MSGRSRLGGADESSFDYVIVGAGSAGCVLAARLSEEPGVTVCLIEAGPRDRSPYLHAPAGYIKNLFDPALTWPFQTEPGEYTAGRRQATTQGRVLGGSSAINGLVYNRGQRADYDNWAQSGLRGWDYASVLPYFQRNERRVGGEDTYRGRAGPLTVTNTAWDHPLCRAFVAGAVSLGLPRNADYNGRQKYALVPDGLGGSGLDRRTGLMLVRRAAYHNLPVPLAEVMLARSLWAGLGEMHDTGLITLAGSHGRDDLSLVPDGTGWRLHGTLYRVPWSRVAEAVLLVAPGPDGQHRWVRAPAGSFTATPGTNLANEPRDTLTFEGATLPESAVKLGPPGSGLLLHGALLRVHQMVGAMQRALDSAVDYAMVRVQFGRTISKFQAVQQMLAEAAGHLAAAVASADATLDAVDDELPLAVAMAKARVGEAAGRVAATAHQVHAAMGFTQEHHLHYSTRHLWSWRDEFGSEPFWQREVGRFVCRRGGEALWPLLADREGAASYAVVKA